MQEGRKVRICFRYNDKRTTEFQTAPIEIDSGFVHVPQRELLESFRAVMKFLLDYSLGYQKPKMNKQQLLTQSGDIIPLDSPAIEDLFSDPVELIYNFLANNIHIVTFVSGFSDRGMDEFLNMLPNLLKLEILVTIGSLPLEIIVEDLGVVKEDG